jgi:hypothetical protein
MRRLRYVCALTTLVLGAWGAASALAAPAPAPGPFQDVVTGQGNTVPEFSFSFDVRSGPSGGNPTGSFTSTVLGQTFAGTTIECLLVSGNTATFVFDTTPPGARFKVTVTDDNVGGDLFGIIVLDPGTPVDCSPVPETFIGFITVGDIVVHDAPVPPTSRAECTNGGWKTFGAFKNQGDCVSFVATKGKNPPAGH